MDWLERWFGFAPDNGDGSAELLIVVAATTVIVVGLAWLHPYSRNAVVKFITRALSQRNIE